MPLIRRILVPMDASPCSAAALEYATSLAQEMRASIDVLHVHEHGDFKIGSETPIAPDMLDGLEGEMDAAIERARERLGDRFGMRIEQGDPSKRILEFAGDYDLVVMGTHGRVGRLHALIGSVAEGVVRNAPCPVLIVRGETDGRESFSERIHSAAEGANRAD